LNCLNLKNHSNTNSFEKEKNMKYTRANSSLNMILSKVIKPKKSGKRGTENKTISQTLAQSSGRKAFSLNSK